MDWTIRSGIIFIVGDYSGQFVIGMENLEEFVETASIVFLKLISSKNVLTHPLLKQFHGKRKIDFHLS